MEESVDHFPNIHGGQLDALEVKLTVECLDNIAGKYLEVHRLMNELSIAKQELASTIHAYGDFIGKRANYTTLVTDPESGIQSYSFDSANRKCLAAAGEFWGELSVATAGLADVVGREARNLLFSVRGFKIGHLQEFDTPLKEKKESPSSKQLSKARSVLCQMKRVSVSKFCHQLGSISALENTESQQKSVKSALCGFKMKKSPMALETLNRNTRLMEDIAMSQAIGGVVKSAFAFLQRTMHHGNIIKNVDACTKWTRSTTSQHCGDKHAELNIRVSENIGSDRCLSPFDPGEIFSEATADVNTSVSDATGCSDSRDQVLSTTYSLGSYYDSVHDEDSSEFFASFFNQVDGSHTASASDSGHNMSPRGSSSRSNSIETSRTSITAESVGVLNRRPDYSYYSLGVGHPTESIGHADKEAKQPSARRGSATTLSGSGLCPRISGHKRSRSVRTIPFMNGVGTKSATKPSFRRPRIAVVCEEEEDVRTHEVKRFPYRNKAYSVLGIQGKEQDRLENELGRVALGECAVNATYRFPDQDGGSAWTNITEPAKDETTDMQMPDLINTEKLQRQRSASNPVRPGSQTPDIRRNASLSKLGKRLDW